MTTGGDILLMLMQTVAALREDMRGMQTHAKEMEAHARRSDQHLAKFGRVLGLMAKETRSRLEDHERRLTKLEQS